MVTPPAKVHLTPLEGEILAYVRDNPGCTVHAVAWAVEQTFGVTRKRLYSLLQKRLIGRQDGLPANPLLSRWYPEAVE